MKTTIDQPRSGWGTAPLRANDIRDQNDKLVLRRVREWKQASQSQIARETGLKAPTVLRIFRDLESRDLIRIAEPTFRQETKKIGRKPVYYEPNPEALYAIGVDFWALSATAIVTNFCGEAIATRTEQFPEDVDADEVIKQLSRLIRQAVRDSGVSLDKIIGMGVGSPGVVDIAKSRVVNYSRIRNMQDLDLGSTLAKEIGLPAIVHNNGAVIALGEYRYGSGVGAESLMVVLVRGGIGCGLIRNGEIFLSRGRTALELGHLCVNFDDKPCPSGEYGCLERYINEQLILDEVSRAVGKTTTIADLDALVQQEKLDLDALLEEPVRALTQAVISLSNLVNPEVFAIVSRSAHLSSYLASKIADYVDHYKYTGRDTDVRVCGVTYDPVRAGRAVADLVFERILLSDMPFESVP